MEIQLGSCGYRCLRELVCLADKKHLLSIIDSDELRGYREKSILSLVNLADVVQLLGGESHAYCLNDLKRVNVNHSIADCLPSIAHLSRGKYQHFVVLLQYAWIVRYIEPGHGRRMIPKCVFDLFFTKHLFQVEFF